MPEVVADFPEVRGEAVAGNRTEESPHRINDHRELEVVDEDRDPHEPDREEDRLGSSEELADDELIRDPEEVEPLCIEETEEGETLPAKSLHSPVVRIQQRRRDQRRNLRVIYNDNEVLPEGRRGEEVLTKKAQGNDIGREPVEVNELEREEESRDDRVEQYVPLVPCPECLEGAPHKRTV